MAKDPRVDAYIAKANDFAKPILQKIRTAVHKGHPVVTETIKWGVPAYVDERGIVCMTAAFKKHCAWVFWTGRTPDGIDATALRRITSVSDLPSPTEMVRLVKQAAVRPKAAARKAPRKTPRPVTVPPYFAAALKQNRKALTAFDDFPPSHKREYVEWIASAKTDETRQRRITQALQWIAAGKSRNWKYQPS